MSMLDITMSQYLVARAENIITRERAVVIGLVLILHASVFGVGMLQTGQSSVQVDEMSVSFAQVEGAQAQMEPMPQLVKPEPERQPAVDELQPEALQAAKPLEPPVEPVATATPVPTVAENSPPLTAAVPVVVNTQPDYRADYLNNPRPSYPMVARRMGYRGKVVLNVEVLAEGRAGKVLLYASSGHEMLDNAALQTVKGWRFTPARRLGQAVTEWFLVPINFSLEDNNA